MLDVSTGDIDESVYLTELTRRATYRMFDRRRVSHVHLHCEVLALTAKHCTMCHARKPTHESFKEAPKSVTLESIGDLRKHAALIMTQTVQNKAMPLGNQTAMTDDERAKLGQWIAAQH